MKEHYGKWKVVKPEGLTLHESRIKKHLALVQSDESDELFVLKTRKKIPLTVTARPVMKSLGRSFAMK